MRLSLRTRLVGAIVGAVVLIFVCSLVAARIVLARDLFGLGRTEITSEGSAFDGYVNSRQQQVRLLVAQEAAGDTVRRALQTHNAAGLSAALSDAAGTAGLSFLTAADVGGRVVARAHAAAGGSIAKQPLFASAALGETLGGVNTLSSGFLRSENLNLQIGNQTQGLALIAAAPISDQQERTIGVLYGGVLLNHYYDLVDEATRAIGGAAALLDGDTIVSSSIQAQDGTRVVDARVPAADAVMQSGQPYIGADDEGGVTYLARIAPVTDASGRVIGASWYGLPMTQITTIVDHTTQTLLFWGLLAVIVVSALTIPIVQALSKTLVQHSRQVRETAKEIGVLIVGSEVSGDHVKGTRQAVERASALVDEMAKDQSAPPQMGELRTICSEMDNDVTVIETLTNEMSTRMQQAVDRVAELNEVAGGLNELVTGESGA
jgi:hypothetical protein